MDIKSQVLDTSRKNASLEQDVKDAPHELRSLRSYSAATVARDNIRVFCRLKPCRSNAAVTPSNGNGVRAVVHSKAHDFQFDRYAARGALAAVRGERCV